MKIYNLTPHDVNVYDANGLVATLPSNGEVRINSTTTSLSVEGFPFPTVATRVDRDEVIEAAQQVAAYNEHPEKEVVAVVVSTFTGEKIKALPEAEEIVKACRILLISPDTLRGALRDEQKRIKGVTQFQVWVLP